MEESNEIFESIVDVISNNDYVNTLQGEKSKVKNVIENLTKSEIVSLLNIVGISPGSDTGHGMHGLAEAIQYIEWVLNGKEGNFETTMTVETDAVTSGYIIKMLQLPIYTESVEENGKRTEKLDIDKIFSEIRKGGIIRVKDGEKTPTYGDIARNEKERDAYETPAKAFAEELNESMVFVYEDNGVQKKWKNGKVTKMDYEVNEEDLDSRFKSKKTSKDKSDFAESLAESIKNSMYLLGETNIDKDGNFITVSRSFMKQPFMVLNYGSGIFNIVKNISKASLSKAGVSYPSKNNLNDLLVHVANGDADKIEIIKKIIRSASFFFPAHIKNKDVVIDGFINDVESARGNQRRSVLDIPVPNEIKEAILSMVESSVVEPISQVFKDSYGELIEATATLNDSTVLMAKLALPKIEKEIVDATVKFNKGKERGTAMVPLPEEKVNEIINNSKHMLPAISLALGKNGENKMLVMEKGKGEWNLQDIEHDIAPESSIKLANSSKTISVRSSFYKLLISYTSGAVIPIHFFDGSIQSKILSSFEALGVHDANFFKLKDLVEGTKEYNKVFFELSKKWSLTKEFLESMNQTLNASSLEDLAEQDKRFFNEYADKLINSELKQTTIHTSKHKKILEGAREYYNNIMRIKHEYSNESFDSISLSFIAELNSKNKIDNDVAGALIALVFELGSEKSLPNEVGLIYKELSDLHSIAEQGRGEIFKNKLYIEHAANPGSGIEFDGINYKKQDPETSLNKTIDPFPYIGQNIDEALDLVKAGIDGLPENVKKEILDIIDNINKEEGC